MHKNEATERFDHLADMFAHRIVGSDGGTDSNAAVLGYLRRYVADTADVDVPVFLGETKF